NDATLAAYGELAVAQAAAGAHVVSPSGMMDGQIGRIREALDSAGHHDVALLAYSAKYSSAFYGPFREAVGSSLRGDRRTYQQDPANARESLREVRLDLEEGADMVMVKPALSYLDILRQTAEVSDVPVAAYQVSGEYAMISAAVERGWIDHDPAVMESLTSIRRARPRRRLAGVMAAQDGPWRPPAQTERDDTEPPPPPPDDIHTAWVLWMAAAGFALVGMLLNALTSRFEDMPAATREVVEDAA